MVACEVGEQCSCIFQSCYALLCDSMATHLHERVRTTCCHHLGEQSVELQGVWRGVCGSHFFLIDVVHDGGEQTDLVSQGLEELIEQRSGSGLAIGARYAHQLQLLAGLAIPVVRHLAQCFVAVLHQYVAYAIVLDILLSLQHYSHGTFRHALFYVGVTISGGAYLCNEQTTFAHPARVKLNILDLLARVACDTQDLGCLD